MTKAYRYAAIVVALGAALSGCDWIKSLGKKDNVEPPTPLVEFTPTASVQKLWSEGAGDGAGDSGARIAPAVVDGKLYAASVDGEVEAIDAASGKTIWQKHLGERHGWLWKRGDATLRWSGGPGAAGDLFVVGSLDGDVYALSATDGSERWHAKVSSEVISRPAIGPDVVVIRTVDGRLTGLDVKDGSQRWVYDQSVPPLSLRGNASPVIIGDAVYDGFDNGKISAIRLADGAPLWSQTLATGKAAPKSSGSPTSTATSCRPARTSSRSAIAARSRRSRPTAAVRSGSATSRATAAPRSARTRSCSPTPTATSGRSTRTPARASGSRTS
jgi:outer membrane protein assembly factor BamB